MDEESLLDVFSGSFETVGDVQRVVNKDSFYCIVAGFIQKAVLLVLREALWRKCSVKHKISGSSVRDKLGMLSTLFLAHLAVHATGKCRMDIHT